MEYDSSMMRARLQILRTFGLAAALVRPTRTAGGVLVCTALLLAPSPARAANPQDQAAAVALFQEARTLATAGDYQRACPKFAEAQRLYPTTGTLLSLGDCYEKAGKLASSWGAFKQAEITARNVGDVERQEEGARRALKLENSLSKLTITVAGSPAGIEVRRDGGIIGEGQWGAAVPVDAGEHVIEVTAPGRQKWTTKVQVAAGGASVAVSVPELPPASAAPEAPVEGSAWGGQRITGVAIGGAGLVSMVVGSVFTAKMVSKNNDSKVHCLPSNPDLCHAEGVALRNEALDASRIATPTFIAGAVGMAAGLVVFLTARRAARSESKVPRLVPVVGPGVSGMYLQGAW